MAGPNGVISEKEIYALALFVERKHGEDGPRYIAERIGKFANENDQGGVDLWEAVASRFARLNETKPLN